MRRDLVPRLDYLGYTGKRDRPLSYNQMITKWKHATLCVAGRFTNYVELRQS